MERVGIKVTDGTVILGTLWQHLSVAEVEENLDTDEMDVLSDWSGDWEPEEPQFPLSESCEYEIVTRNE